MPNYGADDFETIRTNLERIKKEKGETNGVDVNNSPNAQQQGTLGYPTITEGPEPVYIGCSGNDPTQTEAYKRYLENPVTGWGSITKDQGWRDYLLSPIKATFSSGWDKLHSIG